MILLTRFRILSKIVAVLVLMGAMVAGGVWFAAGRMAHINAAYSAFINNQAQADATSPQLNSPITQFQALSYRLIGETNYENFGKLVPQFDRTFEDAFRFAGVIKEKAAKHAGEVEKIESDIKELQGLSKTLIELRLVYADDKMRELMQARIDPLTEKIIAAIADVRTQLGHELRQGSEELNSETASTVRLTWIVMVLILAIGIALAFLICRYGVTNPLRELVGNLDKLAQGEDIEIAGTERRDEIGETARAVNRIRTMLAEQAAREAEEKAARDRRAADELDAAFGSVVRAAVAGDFSQRVAVEGKSGVILNIAAGLNTLCENVAKALDDLMGMLGALSAGDTTRRIDADYQGAFASLKNDANSMAERIGETIAGIRQAAHEVSNASAEISTSTTDLSQRTEEHAASLEETSASMEQISVIVRKNAENAREATRFATETHAVAERGGAVASEAVAAMARIEESSRQISDIIGVIDEIARQTNLLALNAAVEAARAGEAGRGFAVVASEVRSLAQRSAQAAKDISHLIVNSTGQVQEGVELVNRAGASLNDIVGSIEKVAGIVSDIAAASAEQAAGLEQVNKALAQMDQVTQQNSALVEENAATAKALEIQSAAMDERVAFFRLADAAASVQQAGHGRLRLVR
jgi:methyl-accepting chemotaxis protein